MAPLRTGRARGEFEEFAAAHADGLLRSAFLMMGDRGEAEDVVQECLFRIARKWPRVRSMEHPGAYTRRVMVSLVLDGGGRRSRRSAELAGAEPPPASGREGANAAALDTGIDLIRALVELPPRQRAVLVLRYFADLPEAEVAAALGCSLGTVKSSTSRALERLRQALDTAAPTSALGRATETHRETMR